MSYFPYDTSSLLNDLFLGWMFRGIKYFYKNPPSECNLFPIPSNIDYTSDLKSLKSIWRLQIKSSKPDLVKALIQVTYKEYIFSFLMLLLGTLSNLLQAVIINYLVIYLSDSTNPAYEGALLTIAFCIASILNPILKSNFGVRAAILSGKLKCMIANIISKKVLTLNYPTMSEESNRGKIINTVNSDIEAFEMLYFTGFLICAPFVVIASIIIVVNSFGPIGLLGIAISAAHMPFVMLIGKIAMKYRYSSSKIGDTRVKMIENLIEGIKIMKLYAWEVPFLKIIFEKRKEQVAEQSKLVNYNGVTQTVSMAGSLLAIFSTLAINVYLGNTLKPGEAFLLVNIFYTMHMSIVYGATIGINASFMIKAAIKRVEAVLLFKTHTPGIDKSSEKYAVLLNNVTVSWREDLENKYNTIGKGDNSESQLIRSKIMFRECLNNISFRVRHGQLAIIAGPVACGKTSLLMTLLGEINICSGDISVRGKVSYASEEPWIISGSIKENILMGTELDQDRYTATLNSCCLIQDLLLFGNGDETLVGDRGITLSGGQKARLGLARAVYSECNVLLLDDPLSAVDPEVANHIFENCINGQLKGKTVLLATHQIQFLPRADKIVLLNSGGVVFVGSYTELQEDQQACALLGDIAFKEEENNYQKDKKAVLQTEGVNEKLAQEAEKTSDKSISMGNYWRYLKYGFRSVIFLFLFFVFLCVSQACYLSVIYWASVWSKQPTYAIQNQSYYYTGDGVLLLLAYTTISLRVYIPVNLFLRSNLHLHNDALQSIALTPSVYFDKNPTGRIINRFSKDLAIVDGPLQFYLYEFMGLSTHLGGCLIVIMILVPYMVITLLVWIAILFLLLKYVFPSIFILKRLELIGRGPLVTVLTSMLNGLPTIRCLGIQRKFKQEQKQHIEQYYKTALTFNMFMRFSQLYADLGSAILILVNIIIIVSNRHYVPPELAAFSLSISLSLLGVTSVWSKYLLELPSSMAAAQRLLEFTELPSEGVYTTPENYQITQGHIQFEKVYMRYQPEFPLALSGLSFEVQAGEKVGIVGRTGAGKSSVLQVLFRLVNAESGSVFLDGIDFMKLGIHELRQQMSVIPQTAVLFAGSIRDNLDPFRTHSDEEILETLKEVKLKDTILEYDEGLNIEVKGEGISFSAGQKQLLCLARAILRKNKIIMMDEATANVDNETDKVIQKTVKKKFKGCTLLVIAHRIRTIIKSDRIIVIDKGLCQECASPAELFSNPESLFRNMIYSTGPEESSFLISQLS